MFLIFSYLFAADEVAADEVFNTPNPFTHLSSDAQTEFCQKLNEVEKELDTKLFFEEQFVFDRVSPKHVLKFLPRDLESQEVLPEDGSFEFKSLSLKGYLEICQEAKYCSKYRSYKYDKKQLILRIFGIAHTDKADQLLRILRKPNKSLLDILYFKRFYGIQVLDKENDCSLFAQRLAKLDVVEGKRFINNVAKANRDFHEKYRKGFHSDANEQDKKDWQTINTILQEDFPDTWSKAISSKITFGQYLTFYNAINDIKTDNGYISCLGFCASAVFERHIKPEYQNIDVLKEINKIDLGNTPFALESKQIKRLNDLQKNMRNMPTSISIFQWGILGGTGVVVSSVIALCAKVLGDSLGELELEQLKAFNPVEYVNNS